MTHASALSREDFKGMHRGRSLRIAGDLFSLTASPLPLAASKAKFACVVSKKVSTKAVTRNLIKRRCRMALRDATKSMHEPYALAFHAKRSAATASFKEIERDVAALLKGLRETLSARKLSR